MLTNVTSTPSSTANDKLKLLDNKYIYHRMAAMNKIINKTRGLHGKLVNNIDSQQKTKNAGDSFQQNQFQQSLFIIV